MANLQNLIKNEDLTPSQRRKNASKAGKASAKKRAERQTLKEELEILLQKLDEDGKTYQERMSIALIKEAFKGNTKAYEIIRDTIGEKPKENIGISGEINNPFAGMSTTELRKIVNGK